MPPAMPPFLVGEKVNLRPYDVDDVDFLLQMNRPESRRTSWFSQPEPRHVFEEDVRAADPRKIRFIVEEKETRRRVGTFGLYDLDPLRRSATFGVEIVDSADRGKGFGSDAILTALRYAFEELNLNRVGLGVFDLNEDARRLYERLGFVFEGRLREVTFKDGRYVDDLRYSMLAREWRERHGRRT